MLIKEFNNTHGVYRNFVEDRKGNLLLIKGVNKNS